jgi:hypothetical protein
MFYKPFVSLLYSRKFLLALAYVTVAVIQGEPEGIAEAIRNAVLVLMATIAWEDAAKS